MKIFTYKIPTIDSTNSWVKRNLNALSKEALSVIWAERQTAGRGRLQNTWQSDGNNLYLTLCINLPDFSAPFYVMSQLVAITLEETLNAFSINATIKWPNDLLVERKKIAGILIEKVDDFFIIGIGLNVQMTKAEASSITQPATSIFIETGKVYNIDEIVKILIEKFQKNLDSIDFEAIQKSWHQKVQWMLSEKATIQTPAKKVTGTISAISKEGDITLTTENGKTLFHTGEISL